jgi:hypothetical protein
MSYPPHLLDALGRVYAKVALDRLIKDEGAIQPELQGDARRADIPSTVYPEKKGTLDGPASGESRDNRSQPLPEPSS